MSTDKKEKKEKKKYYALGGTATMFWDPQQEDSENKKLTVGQVKPLQETPRVADAKRAGGLVVVDEDDLDEYTLATVKAKDIASEAGEAALAEAARLNEDAAVKLKEADNKLKDVAAINLQNADLLNEVNELKKANEKLAKGK